jgi:hypothetical protein
VFLEPCRPAVSRLNVLRDASFGQNHRPALLSLRAPAGIPVFFPDTNCKMWKNVEEGKNRKMW